MPCYICQEGIEKKLKKMPGAATYLDGFELGDLPLGAPDAAIVATQGKRDRDALRAVLASGAGYKGMVCSRRKLAKLTDDLLKENAALKPSFEELHAPAGLDIGAVEPEEIAMAVVGEMIACRRQGKAAHAFPDTVAKAEAG